MEEFECDNCEKQEIIKLIRQYKNEEEFEDFVLCKECVEKLNGGKSEV